jgi:putative membrane protein
MRLLIAASSAFVVVSAASAQIGNPAGMAPDTRMESPGVPAPNQTNTQDRLFAQLATSGGMAEVDFGRLAAEKASGSAVKTFAQRMVDDHSAANEKLAGIAEKSKIPLPEEIDKDHQAIRADLEKLDGARFDLAYMQAQVVDHQKTVQLLEWEIGQGQDAQLQRFAAETLPTVLDHLEMARALTAELAMQALAEPKPQ